jgi:hypothetical protein
MGRAHFVQHDHPRNRVRAARTMPGYSAGGMMRDDASGFRSSQRSVWAGQGERHTCVSVAAVAAPIRTSRQNYQPNPETQHQSLLGGSYGCTPVCV